jgi:pyridoxal phosphate enzyme (YggS family)
MDKKTEKKFSVLLEINTSKENQKYGFLPKEIDKVLSCFEEPGVLITGLMTVAPFTSDEKKLRSSFKALRVLKEKVNNTLGDDKIQELSMGMSNDYEIAIEEGSTMVRLGTLLFGQRGSFN